MFNALEVSTKSCSSDSRKAREKNMPFLVVKGDEAFEGCED